MTYKQRFREMMSADGFNLPVADALRRLRLGSSDAGWKRLLDRTIAWNQRRQAAQAQNPKSGEAA